MYKDKPSKQVLEVVNAITRASKTPELIRAFRAPDVGVIEHMPFIQEMIGLKKTAEGKEHIVTYASRNDDDLGFSAGADGSDGPLNPQFNSAREWGAKAFVRMLIAIPIGLAALAGISWAIATLVAYKAAIFAGVVVTLFAIGLRAAMKSGKRHSK